MTGPRSDDVAVRTVSSWRDRRRFQHLPWSIYTAPGAARDPNWVPPILAQERQLLGWGHHPFFDNAEIVTLLAERGGRIVGRLAVLVNHVHNRKYNEQRGFFGFFECVNDAAVARALFETGHDWLRQRGMTSVRGPVNPSLNYTCGLLVDGFDRPPCFLMTYNPPYYAALLESCGFAKSQDLYAYEMDTALLATVTERYKPAVLAAFERSKLVIRRFEPSGGKYLREIEAYLDIYNRSLEGTWGFTPLQSREARHIARELRHIIVPQFAVFAEMDGQPIGAVLALLDYNQIIRTQLNGRLFPFGISGSCGAQTDRRRARDGDDDGARLPAIGSRHRAAGSARRGREAVGSQRLGVFVGAREQREFARDAQAGGNEAREDLPDLRPGAVRGPRCGTAAEHRFTHSQRASRYHCAVSRSRSASGAAGDQPSCRRAFADEHVHEPARRSRILSRPTHTGRRRIRDITSPNRPIVRIDHAGRGRMRGSGFPNARAIAMPSSTYETSSAAAK